MNEFQGRGGVSSALIELSKPDTTHSGSATRIWYIRATRWP